MTSPATPEWLAEYASGMMQVWGTGYTDVLEDGYQRKVVAITHPENTDDGSSMVYVLYKGPDYYELEKQYKVTITVEEVD